jgi:hypothetical protein
MTETTLSRLPLLEDVVKIVWVRQMQGHGAAVSHRHPVNGCFLPERGGVEGTPSTNRNFEPFPCFLLA